MNETFPEYNSGEEQPDEISAATAETETSQERQETPNPLIYVASLADYEQGRTHGVWIEAAQQPEDINAIIDDMLAHSPLPDERYAIRASEGFGLASVYETDSIELVSKIARGIKEHGYAYAAWADVVEGSPELLDHFTTAYDGHYESLEAYVRQRAQSVEHEAALDRAVPEYVRRFVHIDYEALGEQLFHDGEFNVYTAQGGGVWIFDERA